MKKIFVILLLLSSLSLAQKTSFSAGVYGDYYIPTGALGDRFEPVIGGSISFGERTDKNWNWSGELEYFKMDQGKEENFTILRNVEVNNVDVPFELQIEGLKVEFEAAGLSANAEYTFIKTDVFESSAKFGFGIYRWFYSRSGIQDTLYADTTGAGDFAAAAVLDVPPVSQTDWSGGFKTGLSVHVKVFEPVFFYADANYKVIIGEIYPALDLGLENISTFQMVNIKAGFRVRF